MFHHNNFQFINIKDLNRNFIRKNRCVFFTDVRWAPSSPLNMEVLFSFSACFSLLSQTRCIWWTWNWTKVTSFGWYLPLVHIRDTKLKMIDKILHSIFSSKKFVIFCKVYDFTWINIPISQWMLRYWYSSADACITKMLLYECVYYVEVQVISGLFLNSVSFYFWFKMCNLFWFNFLFIFSCFLIEFFRLKNKKTTKI